MASLVTPCQAPCDPALGYAKPQNALATHVDREDKSTAPIQGTASNAEALRT